MKKPELDANTQLILDLLDLHIAMFPGCLKPVDPALVAKIAALTDGVEIDLNAPLDPDEG